MRNPFYNPSIDEEEEEKPSGLPFGLPANLFNMQEDTNDQGEDIPDLSDLMDNSLADEFIAHLRKRPRRKDFKDSTTNKITSALAAGLTGSTLGLPGGKHREAIQDWEDEGYGLKEAATLEGSQNIQRRLGMGSLLSQRRAEKRYLLDVKKARDQFNRDTERTNIMKDDKKKAEQHRLNTEAFKEKVFQATERHKGIQEADRAKRTGMIESRIGTKQDKPLDANKQAAIDKQAIKTVAADPRFAKWFDPNANGPGQGGFGDILKKGPDGNPTDEVEEEMDEPTKVMLSAALARAKKKIANMKRSDYDVSAMWAELGGADPEDQDPNNEDAEMQYLLGEE